MTEETVVAVYDTAAHADAAVRDLKAANVRADAIGQHANTSTTGTMTGTAAPAREQGFWSSLFGGEPDHDTSVYDRSLESGATVVSVRVPAADYERISAILEKHDPIDLDERAAGYGTTETTTTRTTAAPVMDTKATAATAMGTKAGLAPTTDGGTIQLSEERLSVGKRAVSGGTTRIRRYVVETPVQEQVTLKSEKVTMDRRPVTDGRPVDAADFTDKVVEMTETREEAVVSKNARVVEEVSLRKDATERVETVKDTVRRQEVEIEEVPAGKTSASRTTGTTGTSGTTKPAGPASPTPKV